MLIDYLSLPVAARVDSARPHDSKTGRMLLDHSLPGLPRVGEVLADLGFEPLVKGIQRRHKVTVTTKGWRKPNKPKGFKLIRPLWKLEDCFARRGGPHRGRSFRGGLAASVPRALADQRSRDARG